LGSPAAYHAYRILRATSFPPADVASPRSIFTARVVDLPHARISGISVFGSFFSESLARPARWLLALRNLSANLSTWSAIQRRFPAVGSPAPIQIRNYHLVSHIYRLLPGARSCAIPLFFPSLPLMFPAH
jgi:hypothetical protein